MSKSNMSPMSGSDPGVETVTQPAALSASPGTAGTTDTHWPAITCCCSPPATLLPNFARCSTGHHPCHQPSTFTQPFLDQKVKPFALIAMLPDSLLRWAQMEIWRTNKQ